MAIKLPSKTFCALPWMHLSTRPDGAMRVCCTANASSVAKTDHKEHGGKLVVLSVLKKKKRDTIPSECGKLIIG